MAARLLLVWLFALVTGIVNACIIPPGMHAVQGAMGAGSVVAHWVAATQAQADHAVGCPDCPGEEATSQALGPCGKFCVDASSGTPSAALSLDLGPALGIAMVPTIGLAIAEPAHLPGNRPHQPPVRPAGLSVAIAFLRLTL